MGWVEPIATVVQAVAVSVAAFVAAWSAWKGLAKWRRELTARRRAEIAEQALAMFYEARDNITDARFPGSFGEEGSTRSKRPNESEDDARYKNALYVPVERLTRQAEFWGKFEAARYPFMALFDEEAAEPFKTIRKAKNRILISARMLIQTHGEVNKDLQHQKRKWEADIGWGLTENDDLAREINKAVSAIERVCKPAIIAASN